jgi:phosphoribosylformylglycinamidine synthase
MSSKVAIIQFPGSNTERETIMACERVGITPIEFLWNEDPKTLAFFDGYIIVGGFSYEDHSRSGVIAAMEPIIDQLKIESLKNKAILGICNGAQILVESGMIPGLKDYELGVALTDNKRINNNQIIGVGYYNVWSNIKMDVNSDRCAFTRHLKKGEKVNIPLAHGEGRFIMSDEVLKDLIENKQTVYRYCNLEGETLDEFPVNPNGSMYNIAALCNPNGNIMAIMPHPERTINGDPIFSSLKEYIQKKIKLPKYGLHSVIPKSSISPFSPKKGTTEWIIEQVITDNEASSVQRALQKKGFDVYIKRQVHWEISIKRDVKATLHSIDLSGELYNSNKEFLSKAVKQKNTTSFLIRKKDDVLARSKTESLKERFSIDGITEIKYGVIWNITVNRGNFESILNELINTKILFNTISHECYRIN